MTHTDYLSIAFYAFVVTSAACVLLCGVFEWVTARQLRNVKAWMDRETAAREAETAKDARDGGVYGDEEEIMTSKLLEIRDRGTFIPALAIQVAGSDGYLMRRAGFESPMIYVIMLATERCCYDPYNWGNRTMANAHKHIAEHFDDLKDGDVIDVEFILGETTAPKQSEQNEMHA